MTPLRVNHAPHCLDCDPVASEEDELVARVVLELAMRHVEMASDEVQACMQEAEAATRKLARARAHLLERIGVTEQATMNVARVRGSRVQCTKTNVTITGTSTAA